MLTRSLPYAIGEKKDYLRGSFKFIGFFTTIMLFILHHEFMGLIIRDKTKREYFYLRSVQRYSRIGLWLLNVKVDLSRIHKKEGAHLIVSNHLSYLDIIVLFSEYPSFFITSKEMGNVFLLGHLTKLAGCIHIERRKNLRTPALIESELKGMKDKLLQGQSIFLFPEGTSSNGESVLPFKAHFFQTALALNLPILPLCTKYDSHLMGDVCWYGDMGFPAHLFSLCSLKEIRVHVREIDADLRSCSTRFEVASLLEGKIKEAYERN
jgi:1-acyl-sn-glycerol-3-phosphate acyltransferase